MISNNTQGNKYHDESTGQFTSGEGASNKAVEPNGDKSFMVGAEIPPSGGPKAAAGGGTPPGGGGNPYHDENDGKFVDKLKQMGFGSEKTNDVNFVSKNKEKNDIDIINNSLRNLIDYAKQNGVDNPIPNSEWADDLYYQLKNDGVEDSEAQRLSKFFADTSEFKHPSETKLDNMGFGPSDKQKFTVSTLDGYVLGDVEASSEEEAFDLASQKYPGLGDELSVDAGQLKEEVK